MGVLDALQIRCVRRRAFLLEFPISVTRILSTDPSHGILERGSNSVANGSGSERIIAQKYEIVIYDLKIAIVTYEICNTRIKLQFTI